MKEKERLKKKLKGLEIETLRYFFHMQVDYSIQHLRWILLFVTLLNGFQELLQGSYICLCIHYEACVFSKYL